MAGGVLSGKYNNGQLPDKARFSRHFRSKCQRERDMANRFVNKKTLKATEKYIELAESIGVSSASLSLAWVMSFKFVASTLTSARSSQQLDDSIKSLSIDLSGDVLNKIEQIQKEIMYPMG